MMVSVLVPTYNSESYLTQLIPSLLSNESGRSLSLEVVVVDNASRDDTAILMEDYPSESVRFLQLENNVGFAAAVNIAARNSQGDILLIVNSDIILPEQFDMSAFIERLQEDRVGIVGSQLLYPNGRWQDSSGRFPTVLAAYLDLLFVSGARRQMAKLKYVLGIRRIRRVEYVPFAFVAITREVFEQAGGLDEAFFFYAEDADLCYRIGKNGLQTLLDETIHVLHFGGGSSKSVDKAAYSHRRVLACADFAEKHLGAGAHYRKVSLLARKLRRLPGAFIR